MFGLPYLEGEHTKIMNLFMICISFDKDCIMCISRHWLTELQLVVHLSAVIITEHGMLLIYLMMFQ